MSRILRIGVDLDDVLIDHRPHKIRLAATAGVTIEPWQANSNLIKRYVPEDIYRLLQLELYGLLTPEAPPVEGALERLAAMEGIEPFLVSARRPESIRYAQEWMIKHRLYDLIPAERMFFCGSDGEKKGYCERFGVSVFLDDKVNVLDLLPANTMRVLFDQDGIAEELDIGERFTVIGSWNDFSKLVKKRRTEKEKSHS